VALDRPSDDDRARREMKWWGWGDPDHRPQLSDHAVAFLRSEVGIADQLRRPVALEDVRLGEPALPEDARKRLAAAVGEEQVRDDRRARVVHAAGKSYPDLVRQRAGLCEGAPDAVVSPGSTEDVRAVLDAAGEAGLAVVPFGGGTSVVGGVDAERGAFAAAISLDLGRMDALLALDERSLTATFGPGIRGPEAEAGLIGAPDFERRVDEDRDARESRVFAQRVDDGEAAHVGEPGIEDDQIRHVLRR